MSIAAKCLHGAGLCVLPSPANNDRPLALRHGPLAATSALLIAAKILAVGIIALTPAPADLSTITASRIAQLTNAERAKAGLPELTVNSQLASAAAQKGNHMLDEDYFAHISPSGVTPWFWISKVGYAYQVAGENLAIDFIEAEDVVAAWLNSPSHRDNMLHSQYTETGVGVVTGEFQGGTSTIVVHMFGLPPGQTPTATPSPAVKAQTTQATPSPSPTPTRVPSPTPSPSLVPVPPADTTPPRTPRIAITGTTVAAEATLQIDGEPGSRVFLTVQSQPHSSLTLPARGTTTYTLPLDSFPDGPLVVRAYAQDPAGNKSEMSDAVALTKDTHGPLFAREDIAFFLSPATDDPRLLVAAATADARELVITHAEQRTTYPLDTPIVIPADTAPLTLELHDDAGNHSTLANIDVRPQFAAESDQTYLAPPTRFSQLTRRLTAAIFTAILFLLLLAMLVRIRIQRPALIAHASFVLLIAGLLFFW